MEERIIYKSTVECPKCWKPNLGEYTAEEVPWHTLDMYGKRDIREKQS